MSHYPVADYQGEYSSRCGYCDNKHNLTESPTRTCNGMYLFHASVGVYQELLDKNWRRCGSWYYQPVNDKICCPQYAIRCNSHDFVRSKRQEKVWRKMQNWLNGQNYSSHDAGDDDEEKKKKKQKKSSRRRIVPTLISSHRKNEDSMIVDHHDEIVDNDDRLNEKEQHDMSDDDRDYDTSSKSTESTDSEDEDEAMMDDEDHDMDGHDTHQVAATHKMTSTQLIEANLSNELKRVMKQLIQSGSSGALNDLLCFYSTANDDLVRFRETTGKKNNANQNKKQGESVVIVGQTTNHSCLFSCNLAVVLMGHAKKNKKSVDMKSAQNLADLIVSKLDMRELVHNNRLIQGAKLYALNGFVNIEVSSIAAIDNHDPSASSSAPTSPVQSKKTVKPTRKLRTKIVSSKFRTIEYNLYVKYQVAVHGDDPQEKTEKGYTRFLCESSLESQETNEGLNKDMPLCGYGSYHIQYWVDDQLIGVSVVDVLEKGLSSVYFFYDPDYAYLSLGVYSALYELDLIRTVSQKFPGFKYYYLGYYIHSCAKMRYKAEYHPSELLCPVTYQWVSSNLVIPKLEQHKFFQFDQSSSPPDAPSIHKIHLLHGNCVTSIDGLRRSGLRPTDDAIRQLQSFVKTCGDASVRILFYIDNSSLIWV